MDNKVHLGDDLIDEAKIDINERAKELVKIFIDIVFDYYNEKVKEL